jgi:hypothetical protein
MMDVSLRDELLAQGFAFRVESIGKVVILMAEGAQHIDAASRRMIVAAARKHGFANACIEIESSHAPVSGD